MPSAFRIAGLIAYGLAGAIICALAKLGGSRFENRVSWWIFGL